MPASDLATSPAPAPVRRGLLDSAARRGAAFAACVLLALFAGYAIGKAAGPAVPAAPSGAHGSGDHDHSAATHTLAVESSLFPLDAVQPLRFTVRGPDGRPVTTFDTVHDKQLHLVVARSDLSGYQHLHPELGAGGVWSVPLRLPTPGTWRMYADFATAGVAATLSGTLFVAGAFAPTSLPTPALSATIDDLTVTIDGTPRANAAAPLTLSVWRGGQPVTGLDRYLGAFGHLVVLAETDLGYLHVHPDEQMVNGGVRFWVTTPGPGRYRAFFDFSLDGVVRTAAFTLVVA